MGGGGLGLTHNVFSGFLRVVLPHFSAGTMLTRHRAGVVVI